MPKAVKRAFLSIFESEGSMDTPAAEEFWNSLERDGRLLEETWA